jgi:hypothetical protein
MQPAICTIIAKNYLAHARCLTDSFLAQHPEGQVFVLLVDEPDDSLDLSRERFTTVRADRIGIPDFRQMAFRYTVLELSTAVKPFFLEYLFRTYALKKLLYFDPDIYFYARIDEILAALDGYGILLTPHLTSFDPEDDPRADLFILLAGVYNLGFIGLADHPELSRLLSWWQKKLAKDCIVDQNNSLFVDQRWMDLVPAMFSSVCIHRDPGCNAAFWNLHYRRIEPTESGYRVNGSPLKFFHFSGLIMDNLDAISKHQERFTLNDLGHLKPLYYGYRDALLANGYEQVHGLPYTYNYFDNGVPVTEYARYVWRGIDGSEQRWPDPFDTRTDASFFHWVNESADDAPPHQPLVSHLAMEVYDRRPDVQKVFRDPLGRDRWAFAEWFTTRAPIEHKIDPVFIQPMADSLKRARGVGGRGLLLKAGPRFYQWARRFYLGFEDLLLWMDGLRRARR